MSDVHAKSIVLAGALDFQSGGLAGSGATYTTSRALRSVQVTKAVTGTGTTTLNPGNGLATTYDIYGADAGVASTATVLGPNASDATLFFTIISGGSNFQEQRTLGTGVTMQDVWLEVEIEPCF
tara:strand:+ start:300 stop:671 length:372 start_codon:yes stop_codon:yes gene_type:complete